LLSSPIDVFPYLALGYQADQRFRYSVLISNASARLSITKLLKNVRYLCLGQPVIAIC